MTEMPPYHTAKDEDKSCDQDDSDSSSDVEDWDSPLCFDQPRHVEAIKGGERLEHTWRVKEKYKTHCVALVLCLNVGVDPPDVVKTQPCARLECWLDPHSMSPSKALESVGHALQLQYERWQPRARYKQSLDPTSEEVKKLCSSLRRNAKDERVLFHYNGHGVPKPTAQGEIWVFNRSYTQYIPLSMYDLQTWMGAPSLYVYDCSNAGVIVDNFKQFAEQHEREHEAALAAAAAGGGEGAAPAAVSYKNCIQLAACAAGQALPMSPELPADLFTACLTTPVKMAIRWFVLRNSTRLAPHNMLDLIDKIPGQVSDRRTMLGELNWLFTAVTDTIAWSSLPVEQFQQLFRADLLTASLFRNFLLAERIMRAYNCTPVAAPALPSLAQHPLWAAWEHTLDAALAQLPALLAGAAEYRHAALFRDQLTAFDVWLRLGAGVARAPPQQLPMVLQVLLSTQHRVRALQLLCRYLALGAHAVQAVLHIGIFPYMLKLLQASAPNLRDSMVFIWSRIIYHDPSCQADLVNAKAHKYFLAVMQEPSTDSCTRTLAAYVVSCIVAGFPAGQEAALQGCMISACLEQLDGAPAALAQWACIALGRLWRGFDAARWAGVRDLAHEKLFPLMRHERPEVRAACAFALGAFMAAGGARSEHANALDQQVAVFLAACLPADASPLVRQEILAALQWLVLVFEQTFIAVYIQERVRRSERPAAGRVDAGQDALAPAARAAPPPPRHAAALALPSIGFGSIYTKLWSALVAAAREPHPQVAQLATDIITYISNQVDSVGREAEARSTSGSSSSLPPSPNTQPSPLHEHARTLPHHRRRPAPADDRDSTSSSSSQQLKKAIVGTAFVEWATERLARDAAASLEGGAQADPESRAAHERAWRRARNRRLRRAAAGLRGARPPRLDTQAFSARAGLPPAALAFHPYEQQAAVGTRDALALWEWGSAARLPAPAWRRDWGRLTALVYVNAHALALLAAASHAGHVAVFSAGAEPRLRAAWRALDVRRAPDYRPPPAQPIYSLAQLVSEQFTSAEERGAAARAKPEPEGGGAYSSGPPGVLLAWSQRRESLAAAGPAAAVRLWDARAERHQGDIATGTPAAATALWRGGRLLAAGFADGGVRAWDERAPAAPALSLPPHGAPVLAAARRADLHVLVSACAAGEVRLYDTRALRAVHTLRAPAPLAAAAVHPAAPLLAVGSLSQSVSVYDLKGALLNTVKFHEGFMGARIGPVACLAFHPLRAALAVGCKDSTVCVYTPDQRR